MDEFPPGFAFLNVLLEPPHIWVVLTPPDEDGEVVLVMLSSLRSRADTTCVIDSKDYSELTRETVIVYRLAEIQTVDWIKNKVDNGFAKPKVSMPAETLRKIQQGALESKQTPRRIKSRVRRDC